jgi:hypothetical protein
MYVINMVVPPSRRQFLLAAAALLAASSVCAHEFHVGICDISYNPRTKNTEIVHTYPMHDIDAAFWFMHNRQPDLAKSADEKLLRDYIESAFVIEIANKTKLRPKWIGVQQDADTLTIFQELPAQRFPAKGTLQNTILRDYVPTQVNNVTIRADGNTKTLQFDRKHPRLAIE